MGIFSRFWNFSNGIALRVICTGATGGCRSRSNGAGVVGTDISTTMGLFSLARIAKLVDFCRRRADFDWIVAALFWEFYLKK